MESKTRDRVSGGFSLPGYVLKVLGLLEASGNEAYVAGGAVRDMLLDLTPHDFDIASSSSPEITAKVLSRFRLVCREHRRGCQAPRLHRQFLIYG